MGFRGGVSKNKSIFLKTKTNSKQERALLQWCVNEI
jgi:hypothetical protein